MARRSGRASARSSSVSPVARSASSIKAVGLKVAEWRYEFETTPTGCRVIETWIDQRGPIIKALGKQATGVKDRAAHNQITMRQTLENLKSEAESTPASG